ncbi:helix-turn-helix domain-containing protein [Limosilactobacillus caviae]|uniref:helix-turn-helix domain-containing protein n=1 Tax=Limosilactobacillus caviae TaxID=1769424 RepID=UPI003519C777
MLKNRLKILLAMHQMKIKDLMEISGLTRSTISNIANNRVANISTENLDKLMNVFGVTPNEFWDYKPEPKASRIQNIERKREDND